MIPLLVDTVEFFIVVSFALLAVALRAIDARGFIASVAVGVSIVYGGGPGWFVILAVFFVLSVAATLYRYGYKKRLGGAQDKGGARSWPNILANGGFASMIAVLNLLRPSAPLASLFLGAISTSAADTVATELGLLNRGSPRLVTNPTKKVTPGTSGGVSPLGFAGAAAASAAIGVLAWVLGVASRSPAVIGLCVVGGLFGSLFDSFLGALAQRKGYCQVCQKPTEALTHCGERTKVTEGAWFLENNVVNLVSTAMGAVAAFWYFVAVLI